MAERIQTPTVHGRSLGVEFVRQADRYGHVIQYIEGNVTRPLLLSVEGTLADQWPQSPVLQQLHIEDRSETKGRASRKGATTERPVALLVGMAGRSHWSLSIEPDIAAAALHFDVACRVNSEESPNLRSTYQQMIVPSFLADERRAFILNAIFAVTVRTEQDPPSQLQYSALGLCISPEQVTGATRRWKYRVELNRV